MVANKLLIVALSALTFISTQAIAQKVDFTEYNLPNGLHVILHQDHTAPVVAVSVIYHVGSRNEVAGKTGFAHFFEHLLFEGSENIKRGDFNKLILAKGGEGIANTTQDRTFYYEVFPSNEFKMGLWLESERMMHPVINEIGVKTQNEVIKEENRLTFDNHPFGNIINDIGEDLFTIHPYHNRVIGSMKDLDSAKLGEFKDFFKQFYVPNNAVLTISGDINLVTIRPLIESYFGPVPRGKDVTYTPIIEKPITKQIIDTAYDANIQIPAILIAYRMPGKAEKDFKVMRMISNILSGDSSARINRTMIDEKKTTQYVFAFSYELEDYGMYMVGASPHNGAVISDLLMDMGTEVARLQKDLISPADYQKQQNHFEDRFVSENTSMLGISENLADGYLSYNKNTGKINSELTEIRSITREQIREAARKYLSPNQRLVLYYLPKKVKS